MISPTDAHTFFSNTHFKLNWRPYQQRVLSEFDRLIQDRHFHVAAAPGAGKTVLGLEAVRRIAKPALILAPSLGIRDQWISRLNDLFSFPNPHPPVSTDVARPGLLTADTYQGLHSFCRKHSVTILIHKLKSAGVETLVLDEAHHLRQEWWQSLFRLKEGLQHSYIIALTATPPYDVPQVEWNRYMSLCGPMDAEISIPELVKVKNLCPHQDFIYFSRLAPTEEKKIEQFRDQTCSFLRDLALNQELVQAIKQHPVLQSPRLHLDAVLGKTEYFISLAVFLKHASGLEPSPLLRFMGLKGVFLPEFNRKWSEHLLNGLLFHDRISFTGHDETILEIQQELNALRALERKRVHLCVLPVHRRLLRASSAKLSAIADIVELESFKLKEKLRMLILTDFIREESFPDLQHQAKSVDKIGVVPIFEHLRRLQFPNVHLAIATGKLAVIPITCCDRFFQLFRTLEPQGPLPRTIPLWHAPQYVKLEGTESQHLFLHEIFAQLLSEGRFQIIVGTNAFLGEGWDAPTINTQILVTTTSTFITSSQLRGRALRIDPVTPDKTANIWHLCCFDSDLSNEQQDEQDWSVLLKRFQSIYGVGFASAIIENGVERLHINPKEIGPGQIEQINAMMCREAEAREQLMEKWQTALDGSPTSSNRMFQEVFIPVSRFPGWKVIEHQEAVELGWIAKIRLSFLQRRLKRIALCLLEALAENQHLSVLPEQVECRIHTGSRHLNVTLRHIGLKEETEVIQSLIEVFDLLSNPRYILIGIMGGVYAVPRLFGENQESARCFLRHWRRRVGQSRLVYAHSPEGKQILLKKISQYLAGKYREEPFTKITWG